MRHFSCQHLGFEPDRFIHHPYYEEPIQSLKELEKRYRNLFNSISDLIMIHDLEGRLLNVNPAVSQLSGYTFEKLIGRPISDFIIPKFRHLFRDEYLKRRSRKKVTQKAW